MSSELQNLVERYQAGENVRGVIEQVILEEEIVEKLFYKHRWLAYYDFNNKIYHESLDYSLKKYRFDMKMKFSSYLHMVYFDRLKNEHRRQERQENNEAAIKDREAYFEATKLFRENYSEDELFNNCIYITDNEFLEMSDREYEYLKITMQLAKENKKWHSNEAAAEVLGVNADTIRRYENNLRGLLIEKYKKLKDEKNKRYKAAKIADDLQNKPFKDLTQEEQELIKKYGDKPLSIFNEHGIKDPTPWKAIRNIEKGKS